jgi:hypothetical protein
MSTERDTSDNRMDDPSREALEEAAKDLTDQKLQAVQLLVAGTKPGVVATLVGISREQLWRWRRDPVFDRHLQVHRLERHSTRVDRVWNMADKALDVIEEALDEGDPQAAIQLLRLLAKGLGDRAATDDRVDARGEREELQG